MKNVFLHLVRHGEVNEAGNLTPRGELQARLFGQWLQQSRFTVPQMIVSSCSPRARQTAYRIQWSAGVDSTCTDVRLGELQPPPEVLGSAEYQRCLEEGGAAKVQIDWPGKSQFLELYHNALMELAHLDRDVLIVSHGAAIQNCIASLTLPVVDVGRMFQSTPYLGHTVIEIVDGELGPFNRILSTEWLFWALEQKMYPPS